MTENMIRKFNKKWEEEYLIKKVETLQVVTDRRNAAHDKNAKRYATVRRLPTLRRQ